MSEPVPDPSSPEPNPAGELGHGLLFAAGAFLVWGLSPIFWKLIDHVPAYQLLAHRVAWSFLIMLALLFHGGHWASLVRILRRPRVLLALAGSTVLITSNWFLYIYSVTTDRILQASLGYFINPLVSVALGVLFFRERLRSVQWLAIALATVGVAYLTWVYGQLPWISLSLAFSFAFYAILKKIAPLGASEGLTLETAIMTVPALVVLASWQAAGTASLGALGLPTDLLLIGSGAATALPLLFFGAAARR
ncbi:MAG: EamA family transporter RarD, partial [Holophagales bacterium]|nr:EamA family transporter RarD [Holophagales bacterium]